MYFLSLRNEPYMNGEKNQKLICEGSVVFSGFLGCKFDE